jgi:hypothetical protein
MKRLALVLAVLASGLIAKAQTKPLASGAKIVADNSKITYIMPTAPINIVDGKVLNYQDTTFKISPYLNRSNITLDQLLNTTATVNADRMPIAKPTNTDPHMPVVKTDKTAYNMPIVGNKKSKPQIILEYKTKSGADSLVYVK